MFFDGIKSVTRCSLGEYQLKNNLLKQVKSFQEVQTLIEFTEFENQIVLEGPYSYTLLE